MSRPVRKRSDLVETARSFVKTPHKHQGRLPGIGIDCVGVPVCVAILHGIPHEDYTNYGRRPDPAELIAHLERNLDRIDPASALPADILCFWIRGADVPQHLGIITPYGLVHSYAGSQRVVETVLGAWEERIHSAWRYRVELVP